MPIHQLSLPIIHSVRYYCWRVVETLPESGVDAEVVHRFIDGQKNAKMALIKAAFGAEIEVQTYPEGKPKPIGDTHISFSHSREMIVLACSSSNVGIDLQFYTDKLVRVSRKFVSEAENELLSSIEALRNRQIHFMWSAKEAVFKLYGTEVPFKEIVAQSLELGNSGEIEVIVKNQYRHTVSYLFFDDFCFCIAL